MLQQVAIAPCDMADRAQHPAPGIQAVPRQGGSRRSGDDENGQAGVAQLSSARDADDKP